MKRKVRCIMDCKKIHSLLPDVNLKMMRIKEHPIGASENLVIYDGLETEGRLKFYENVGGNIYLSVDPSALNNLVLVAVAEVEETDEKELKVKKIFHEYGYDELWNSLVDQLFHFADFYGFSIKILDLRKRR